MLPIPIREVFAIVYCSGLLELDSLIKGNIVNYWAIELSV